MKSLHILKTLIAVLFLLPMAVSAQNEWYSNGGSLYIQKGAILYIKGSFTNANNGATTGVTQNDGVIELTGNFTNNTSAQFKTGNDATSTDRAVKFIGSGTQTINGSMATKGSASFYNLVVDKVNATDTVEMRANVMTEGSVVFGSATTSTTYNPSSTYTNHNKKGLLKTFNNSLGEFLLDVQCGNTDAIAGYASLTIGGAPTSAYIITRGWRATANGGLQRAVTSAASYVWPIGTIDNGFNAVRLNFSAIASGGGNIKGKFCDSTSGTSGYVGKISRSCSGCGQNNIDNTGYNRFFVSNSCNGNNPQWITIERAVKNHGYWSFSSSNTGYTYWMEVFPNSYYLNGTMTDAWRVLKYSASYGFDPSVDTADWGAQIESSLSTVNDLLTYTKNTGCYTGTGVPGGKYTNFSHFTMQMAQSGGALPVELVYLEAKGVENTYIEVSWSTATEVNNAGFDVMRTSDGVNFTKVGYIDGHNNSTTDQYYTFNDYNVVAGVIYYYKLKQIDNNGQSQETGIVQAALDGGDVLEVGDFFPNPAMGATRVSIKSSVTSNIEIKLFDLLGRDLGSSNYNVSSGVSDITLDTRSLPASSYTVVIRAGEKVFTRKVVVGKN